MAPHDDSDAISVVRSRLGLAENSPLLGKNSEKLSISLPAALAESLRDELDKGEISSFVAEAVALRLEWKLLEDLDREIDARRGTPIPSEYLEEAETAWPDVD
ncbi:hypothetical protein LX16_3229 [Stackebrandtia albiflava]|uniref:Uncharacterized protein n=1 Tax=Stackebrandtia albiflava TaxID=406432 RepID=A0A562V3K9_9ACTN|nr:hypothetical protein [Stackebrandtia albiflava]TWJ12471.1 hypothetical protein LX16_3229 [Stackebrandtia albiflava]